MSKSHQIVDKIPEFPYFVLAFFYMFLHPGKPFLHIFAISFIFMCTSLAIGIPLKMICRTCRPREYTTIRFFKYGFPSLHSMISIGTLAFVYYIDKIITFALLPVGIFYVYSRIKMKFHTPIDVIGGAILGLSLGALFGFYGLGITLPSQIEFLFAVLFFVVPIGFSIGRIRASR